MLRNKPCQRKNIFINLKITLKWSKPPIWRRLLVSSDTRLDELHDIIQNSMGWYDCHLHQFSKGERGFAEYYGATPDPEFDIDFYDVKDETKFRIDDLLTQEKDKIEYWYDFGDDWVHFIVLEKILNFDKQQPLPICLKGRRACPPEDIGGMGGYEYMLAVINDKNHPEYQDITEWLGIEENNPETYFDPEFFDIKAVNTQLNG